MKRREFIAGLSGAAAWPRVLRAQQTGRAIRLGFLGPTLNNPPAIAQYQAFHTQLGDFGFAKVRTSLLTMRAWMIHADLSSSPRS
jgi:hypothetical protein